MNPSPLYKIDISGSSWWKYAVYARWCGFWWTAYQSDDISSCEKYVEEALKLPKYFYRR